MKTTAPKTKNGFEFYSQQLYPDWFWYFRPLSAEQFVAAPGKKADVLALLDDPVKAVSLYDKTLRQMADVAAAEAALRTAEAFHTRVQDPEWDPGGSTNNPGKVKRALEQAADSANAVERAKERVTRASELAQRLQERPFDAAEWLSRFHPGRKLA